MFASVAILEDVANFEWGNVVGAPEQLLELANTPMKISHARFEVLGACVVHRPPYDVGRCAKMVEKSRRSL